MDCSSSSGSISGLRLMNKGEITARRPMPIPTSLSYDENLLVLQEKQGHESYHDTTRLWIQWVSHLVKFLSAERDKAMAKISTKSSKGNHEDRFMGRSSSSDSITGLRLIYRGEITARRPKPMNISLSHEEDLEDLLVLHVAIGSIREKELDQLRDFVLVISSTLQFPWLFLSSRILYYFFNIG